MPRFGDCNCKVLWKRIISLVHSRATRISAQKMSSTDNSVGEIRIPCAKRTCFREQESQAGAPHGGCPVQAPLGRGFLRGLHPLKFREQAGRGLQPEAKNEIITTGSISQRR